MKLLKKHYKLLILLLICLLIFLIYQTTNSNNLNYTALGDGYAQGIDSYGRIDYGYSDFIKDYYTQKNKLYYYSKTFTQKDMSIEMLYNYILINKKMKVKSTEKNIRGILRESDYLTLNIGINDLLYKFSTTIPLTDNNLDNSLQEIATSFNKLIFEIKKYYPNNIYVIGYYPSSSYSFLINNYISKLNNIFKNNKNVIYIDIENIFKTSEFLPNPNSPYPTTAGYKEIANKIIKSMKNEKNLEI